MKTIFKKIIGGIILLSLSLTAYAADPLPAELIQLKDTLKNQLSESALSLCNQKLGEIYDIATLQFLKFLEENFQNKSSTSSLVNTAIVRYGQYRDELNDTLNKLAPTTLGYADNTYGVNLPSFTACSDMTQQYIQLAKEQMLRHIQNNNAQKRTSMLLEKYQSINSKMRDLNMAVAKLYSFFQTFKNKLPGFLSTCI